MPFCSHTSACVESLKLRVHTNPTLPCVGSARKPQGMKSIPSLAEHWEPVFQVISVCRTKQNSPAAQVGGRAALAPGRNMSCRAPRAPVPKGKPPQQARAEQVPLPQRPDPQKSETAALVTLHELMVREMEFGKLPPRFWGAGVGPSPSNAQGVKSAQYLII